MPDLSEREEAYMAETRQIGFVPTGSETWRLTSEFCGARGCCAMKEWYYPKAGRGKLSLRCSDKNCKTRRKSK